MTCNPILTIVSTGEIHTLDRLLYVVTRNQTEIYDQIDLDSYTPIEINNPKISRIHATLRRFSLDNPVFSIRDGYVTYNRSEKYSTNGTKLNNTIIKSVYTPIFNGDHIYFGGLEAIFSFEDACIDDEFATIPQ